MLRIGNYLPDTATSAEHDSAKKLKSLLDKLALAADAEVTSFEIQGKGVAIVELSKETAIEPIMSKFRALDRVEVSALDEIVVQFEENRAQQETINKKRQAKAQRREGAH
jgi:hypothetical protein